MTNFMLIGAPGGWELLVLLFVILLLFGSTRLPQLAKGMGKSIREFKRGISESDDGEPEEDAARRAQLRAGESARMSDEELASDRYPVNKPR